MNIYGSNQDLACQSFLNDQQDNDDPTQIHNYNNNDQFVSSNNNVFDHVHIQPSIHECQIVSYDILGSSLPFDDPTDAPDIPDTCFNYITELLREKYCSSDDHFDTPNATLHDYMAAQMSYNKSIDAALDLGENFMNPISSDVHHFPPPDVCPNSRYCLVDDYLSMFSSTSTSTSILPCVTNVSGSSHNMQDTMLNEKFGSSQVRNNVSLVDSSSHGVGPNSATMNINVVGEPAGGGRGGRGDSDLYDYDEATFGFMVNDYIVQQGNDVNLSSEITTHLENPISVQSIGNMRNSEVPISRSGEKFTDDSRRRKHDEGNEKEDQYGGQRRNKHSAPCNDEIIEQIEQYGDVILCPEGRSKPGALCNSSSSRTQASGKSSKGSKKRGSKGPVVDLRGLLTRCAQCIAQVDLPNAYEMLMQIRQHSSPYGDFLQRVAHYLANGLEARLEGKGLELTLAHEEVSPSEVLKANRIYVASVPYQIMSYYTMNKTIARLVEEAPSIHIIDFGIYYGLQWPCIIQNLSKRPNGPPRIRITGIDFPQRGFRPSERVEETGRCLAKYCEKYSVPFEYHPIAKKWEDVQLDELKIERNEPLVVNSLYRAHLLSDDSVDDHSPRDAFLKLVRKINPDIFIHAIVNSTSSVPFFLNRFKEAMFHYSALFDIFESTMSKEDNERMLLESKLYGPQALNVIACEGVERVERPESYKQWQVRTQRAGFEQVALDRELVKRARAMVRRSFREEFSYDEDGYWVVQGWKGRILYAISCWKPTQE